MTPLMASEARDDGAELGALQLVADARHLAIARAVDGVGEEQLARIGVVQARRQLGEVAARVAQVQRVELRGGRQLGVVFQVEFAALGLGVAQVGHQADLADVELVVPAVGVDGVVAAVVHAAHQRVDIAGGAAGEGAVAVDRRVGDVETTVAAVVVAEVDLELVGGVLLRGLGVEQVQRAGPGVGRTPLDRGHHGIALGVAGAAQGLDAVGEVGAGRNARTPSVADLLPGLVQAHLVFLGRGLRMRIADDHAQRVVHELADVAGIEAVAEGAGIGGTAERVVLAAHTHHEDVLLVVQRTDGLQVEGAGQALADQAGLGGLVHGDAADQLDGYWSNSTLRLSPVLTISRPLSRVVAKSGRQAAHADHLRATRHALGRHARQARDRFGDAHVGQLADVLGRDGLDDLVGRLLLAPRSGYSVREAAHRRPRRSWWTPASWPSSIGLGLGWRCRSAGLRLIL